MCANNAQKCGLALMSVLRVGEQKAARKKKKKKKKKKLRATVLL